MLTAIRRNRTMRVVDKKNYLTFTAVDDNVTIVLFVPRNVSESGKVEYIETSLNNGVTWTRTYPAQVTHTERILIARLSIGESVKVRGKATTYYSSVGSSYYHCGFYTENNKRYAASGNIMSLFSRNFESLTSVPDHCFYNLFYSNALITPPELPATTLGESCYEEMFDNCTLLETAPELPATIMTAGCYARMFRGCTSLVTAPNLPSTNLAENCYNGMFNGCTSLINPPALPATTLVRMCYFNMFLGCSSLVTAPELPATDLTSSDDWYGCYQSMFKYCTSLINPPALPATILARYCYQEMFYGCTALVNAPLLPAITVPNSAYYEMFYGCTQLNKIIMLATSLGSQALYNWVKNVAVSGTFVKNSAMSSLLTGDSGIPSGWTVQDYNN